MESKNEKKIEHEKPENAVNLDENDLKDVSGGIPTPKRLVPMYPGKNENDDNEKNP